MTVSPATNSIKEKKMRKTLCVSALVLALCGSAFAGDTNSPPLVGPKDVTSPLFTPRTSGEETADGIVQDDYTDSVAAASLTLLDSLLALL
jgi:hypothetical protein